MQAAAGVASWTPSILSPDVQERGYKSTAPPTWSRADRHEDPCSANAYLRTHVVLMRTRGAFALQVHALLEQLQELLRRAEVERDRAKMQLKRTRVSFAQPHACNAVCPPAAQCMHRLPCFRGCGLSAGSPGCCCAGPSGLKPCLPFTPLILSICAAACDCLYCCANRPPAASSCSRRCPLPKMAHQTCRQTPSPSPPWKAQPVQPLLWAWRPSCHSARSPGSTGSATGTLLLWLLRQPQLQPLLTAQVLLLALAAQTAAALQRQGLRQLPPPRQRRRSRMGMTRQWQRWRLGGQGAAATTAAATAVTQCHPRARASSLLSH